MATVEGQILTVILLLLVIKFCQLSVYPYLKPALKSISYGLAYPVGILLLTLFSWYLGIMGLPVQFALLPFAGLAGFAVWKKQYSFAELKEHAVFDIVFLAGFFFLLAVRFTYPGIIPTGEKFMDAAFLGSVMNNPVVTPADPWFGGAALSIYYYLGHWMMGVLGILALGESTVVFNLMLPVVCGLAAVAAYSIGRLMLRRGLAWLPLLVLVLPDIALFVNFALGKGLLSSWWDSTRVIGEGATINEYPLFSFLWGDPHAHVLGCFNQLVFLCLLLVMLTQWKNLERYGKYLLAALLALSLGTMPAMNSWDVIIYAALYLGIAFLVWRREERRFSLEAILPFALVPVLSIASYGYFLLQMVSAGGSSIQGFALVSTPSALLEFLGVWGIFLGIIFLNGLASLKKYPWLIAVPVLAFILGWGSLGAALFCLLLLLLKKEKMPETILAMAGLAALIFMELFYLKDYMGDAYYRMNTVFKFGFICWFILGTSSLLMIGRAAMRRPERTPKPWRERGTAVAVYVAVLVLVLVFGINLGYTGGTLDGSAWLETTHPGDAVGIQYLKEHAAADDIVVEAVGTSYAYSSRVSAITGLATIVGWSGHESGWRSGVDNVAQACADVKAMYENPLRTLELMKAYGAHYLFVGELERSQYSVSLPAEGLTEVFHADGVSIYQIN